MTHPGYEVTLAYVHADREWVLGLAQHLATLDVSCSFDEWTLDPTGVVAHRLDDGARRARAGVVVITSTTMSEPWAGELQRVLLRGALAGGRPIIPVVRADADQLPSLLDKRAWVDLRGGEVVDHEAELFRLVQLLKGERPDLLPRVRGQNVVPGAGVLGLVPVRRRLVVRPETVALYGGERVVMESLAGRRDLALEQALATEDVGEPGARLAEVFLAGAVGEALEGALASCTAAGTQLELSVEVDDPLLTRLPWESLGRSGGPEPLALHPAVTLLRSSAPGQQVPLPSPAAALSIVVALSAPGLAGGDPDRVLLEKLLDDALDVVEPALGAGTRLVVLDGASVRDLREALELAPCHVLYLAAPFGESEIVLEGRDGVPRRLSPRAVAQEIFGGGRFVPLVLMAPALRPGEDALEHQARARAAAAELVDNGLAEVLVVDPSRPRSVAQTLRLLAENPGLGVPAAVAEARRGLAADGVPNAAWARASLHGAGPPLVTHRVDPQARLPLVPARSVGRRLERTRLLRSLRQFDKAGVLLSGRPGSGTSALAHHLADTLRDDGWIPVRLSGPLVPDEILEALAERLAASVAGEGAEPSHPVHQTAMLLKRCDLDPLQRLERLSGEALKRLPVILLLDDFDHNLGPDGSYSDPGLAAFLTGWLRAPGRTRLVLASTRRPQLAPAACDCLEEAVLGGLAPAEARRLTSQLPHLAGCAPTLLRTLERRLEGLPQGLVLVDRQLAGLAVEERGAFLSSLSEQMASRPEGDAFGRLVDVLLGRHDGLARRLLRRASLLRMSVDRDGLAWLVSELQDRAPDGERAERLARLHEAIREARTRGEEPNVASLGFSADSSTVWSGT